MTKLLAPIALAVAALAAGCTLQPHYQRPAAPVPAAYPASGVYATGLAPKSAAGEAPSPQAVDLGWREFFADPRLQRLIELSLYNNRDLRVAVLRVQQAAAQFDISRAALFPSISLGGENSRSREPKEFVVNNHTVANAYSVDIASASYEIDFFGRIRSLKDVALDQYLSTAQARKAAEIALIDQVASQYLTLLAADEQLKVTRDTLKTSQDSYNLAKTQFDVGTGTELSEREAEGVVETASANLAAQLRARAQAVNALVLLVGQPLPDDLPPSRGLNDQNLLADVPAGLPSDLLTRRPDIMEAEETLLSANANIGAARAAFFPRVALTGQFGTLAPTLGTLFKPGSAAWSFAPQISVPIFTGGLNRANLDVANIEKNVAIAQYEKAIQTAFREVADGLAARGTYDNQIDSLQNNVKTQQRLVDLSTLRFKGGVDNYLTVLTAQTNLYSAQQQLITARLERLTNLVTLYQALGGGWLQHSGDQPRPADAPLESEAVAAPASGASATAVPAG